MGKTAGCFELDAVVTIGVTTGPVYRLFVNDSAGGNYAGMRATCSASNAAHPCTVGAAVGALPQAESVTLKGAYTYSSSTKAEDFYIDAVTDDGAGVAPAPLYEPLMNVSRSSTQIQDAFQRFTIAPMALSHLLMYDWSPSEFAVSGATQCPYQVGFGVSDQSDGLTPGMACTGTSQPPGQSSPSPREVLIGTDFAPTFTVSSDCACASTPPTPTSSTGYLAGILVWNVSASGAGYMYVAPQSNNDMPNF